MPHMEHVTDNSMAKQSISIQLSDFHKATIGFWLVHLKRHKCPYEVRAERGERLENVK